MIIVRPMAKVSSTPEITGTTEAFPSTAVSSLPITLPTADVGDLRVVIVSYYNVAANVVSGWDTVGTNIVDFHRMATISRRKQAGDPDTISLTFSAATTSLAAKAWTIANGGTATMVGVSGNGTVHGTPSIGTTTKNNVVLRAAFSGSASYTWSPGPTPYSDIVAGRRMASAFQLSQAIELLPVVNATVPSNTTWAASTVAIGTYFTGPTTAQKGSLTSTMTGTTINVDNEIGPWTAAGTHPGTVLVGNGYRITNGGRATVSLNVTRGNFSGTMIIKLWIDGVLIATQQGGANASTTTLNAPVMDLEDASLITATFQSTSNFSGSNNVTAATLEITPV
jgi:hypothetical protein